MFTTKKHSSSARRSIARVLGWRLDPLTLHDLNAIVERAILAGARCLIASQNLHALQMQERHAELRRFYAAADHVRVDGMPLILFARVLGLRLTRDHRVTWLDWIWSLMSLSAERGWRIYYLGGRPGVAVRGANHLRERFPELQVATASGYFDASNDSAENAAAVEAINRFNPDILMVGMGMPRQELWILDNADRLNARVILPCGACFDYLAGEIPTPPRWLGRIGFEWSYRLLTEPGRLWHRYLAEPWLLAFAVGRRVLMARPVREQSIASVDAVGGAHGHSRQKEENACSPGL